MKVNDGPTWTGTLFVEGSLLVLKYVLENGTDSWLGKYTTQTNAIFRLHVSGQLATGLEAGCSCSILPMKWISRFRPRCVLLLSSNLYRRREDESWNVATVFLLQDYWISSSMSDNITQVVVKISNWLRRAVYCDSRACSRSLLLPET